MPITRLESDVKIRNPIVYDLEWIPGSLKVRVCGVFNGATYKAYRTVADFLSSELTSANQGRWFYAHAAGWADVQFVLDVIMRDRRYSVEASFSGSSAIIVRVTRGRHHWLFVDSFWLLRAKLADIGKWIGMGKTGPSKEEDNEKVRDWYATVPLPELIEYNQQDCVILWTAIRAFQNVLLDFGGELMATIASCAMRLFRRKYLQRDIKTSDEVNEKARKSYFASRVEVFARNATQAKYYDINSSFPYAMTFPCPGELIGVSKRLPLSAGKIYIADVDIEVPEDYLPCVPVRIQQRVFFPVGKWRGWLTNIDLELLLSRGGKVHKVHEVMHFAEFNDLSNYAKDIYARRKASSDVMEKTALKFLLNSLYGKFAESREKVAVHVNPPVDVLKRLSREKMLMPGVFLEDIEADVPHMHVPIAAHITARARKTLFDFLAQSKEIHYCDTDGFSTKDEYPVGEELGQLKLERLVEEGQFIAPKLYRMRGLNDKGEFEDKVKAKGFSLGRDKKQAVSKWLSLVKGEEIYVERMIRIRENLKRGSITPKESIIIKRLSRNPIHKRHTFADGSTRPWHVGELEAMFKGRK
jgi:hypothetical protein